MLKVVFRRGDLPFAQTSTATRRYVELRDKLFVAVARTREVTLSQIALFGFTDVPSAG
jgi:hypothetical protein